MLIWFDFFFVRYEDEYVLCGGFDGLDVVKDILCVLLMLLKFIRCRWVFEIVM